MCVYVIHYQLLKAVSFTDDCEPLSEDAEICDLCDFECLCQLFTKDSKLNAYLNKKSSKAIEQFNFNIEFKI